MFLTIRIDFLPIKYDGENWECSLDSNWIPFNKRGSWQGIADIDFSDSSIIESNQTTFYFMYHRECNNVTTEVSYLDKNLFQVTLGALVENESPLKLDAVIPFTGFSIARDGFFPKPDSTKNAIDIASEFIDVKSFHEPSFENRVYSFEPKYHCKN